MAAFILKMLGLPVQVYSISSGEGTNYKYPSSKIAQYPNNNSLYKYVNTMLSSCGDCAKGLNVVNIAEYVPILGEPGADIESSYYGYTDSFIHDDTYNSDGTSVNVGYNTQDTTVYGPVPGDSTTYNMVVDGCKYSRCGSYPDPNDASKICYKTFQDYYNAAPKINEANIPYLHGELVKYGTLPWNVFCNNVVCECGYCETSNFSCFYTDLTNFDKMADTGTFYSMALARCDTSSCGYCTPDDKILCDELFGPLKMSCGYGLVRLGVYNYSCFDPTYQCEETIEGCTRCYCGSMHFDSRAPYIRGTSTYYFIAAKNCIGANDESATAFLGTIYKWDYQNGNLEKQDHASQIYRCVRYANGDEPISTHSNCLVVLVGEPYKIKEEPVEYACTCYVYLDVASNSGSISYPVLCPIPQREDPNLLDTMACAFCIEDINDNKYLYLVNGRGDQLSDWISLQQVADDANYSAQLNDNMYVINYCVECKISHH